MLHPISFSIPADKIVAEIPPKTKLLSSLIPGDRSTYIYDTEEAYYDEYKQSLFAKTTKKAGWDCMRHYEILACGAIPYFPDLEECPETTMVSFPKELVKQGNALYLEARNYTIHTLPPHLRQQCDTLIEALLDYTRRHLTTKRIAEYILAASGHQNAKRVAFLSGSLYSDYLRCLCLHGFKELFGKECHDIPRIPHIYTDSTVPYEAMWGRGFSISKLLPPELHDTEYDASLSPDLIQRKYDLILYGSYHRGTPLYNELMQIYGPERIVMLCGEDIHNCNNNVYTARGHHVFVREQ